MALRTALVAGILAAAGVRSAPVANLLVNSDFAADLSGWTSEVAGTGASASVDANIGNPEPGSANLDAPNPSSTIKLSQCVAVAAPLNVDLIANTYTDASSGTSRSAVQIESFDMPDCTGMLLETQATTETVYMTWGTRSLPNHPLPDGTQSVRVALFVDSGDSNETLHFDHVVFVAETIFRDGFDP